MTGEVSTILVMGPQGSGKSEFIQRLAGKIKLKPNGDPTDSLREISVSPYFSDGETVKFVKFPGFDESGTDPTDAKLFIGLATFLGDLRRRGEVIRSIIYIHPITNDGVNPANVEFNAKMLQEIAKDTMGNVVIVTTKWDGIPESSRDSMEAELREGLMQFYQDPFMRHDDGKWSALGILNNAKKKTPTLLDLKHENPALTSAGGVLIDHINRLMDSNRDQEADLERELAIAERENNKDREDQLNISLEQVVGALNRLRSDKKDLRGHIDWDQAFKDNKALEGVLKERHDSATKDWKAEYDKLVNESKAKAVEYDKLVNENKVLKTAADKYRLNVYQNFSVRLRATSADAMTGRAEGYWAPWLVYTTNEEVYGTDDPLPSMYSSHMYLVRNNAGRVGVVPSGNFIRI